MQVQKKLTYNKKKKILIQHFGAVIRLKYAINAAYIYMVT